MRIIGGAKRRRLIRFPEVEGLRPTPDRVRETVFNWLGQDLTDCACLDLYAGSGALGFEAASRGAQQVVMVERDANAAQALVANAALLEMQAVTVQRVDALEFLRHPRMRFDVIFLDPPFAEDHWQQLFEQLPLHLNVQGLVYCERRLPLVNVPGWEIVKSGRAGQVHFYLFKQL